MGQLSFYSADARPRAVTDIEGLLCAGARLTVFGRGTTARLGLVLGAPPPPAPEPDEDETPLPDLDTPPPPRGARPWRRVPAATRRDRPVLDPEDLAHLDLDPDEIEAYLRAADEDDEPADDEPADDEPADDEPADDEPADHPTNAGEGTDGPATDSVFPAPRRKEAAEVGSAPTDAGADASDPEPGPDLPAPRRKETDAGPVPPVVSEGAAGPETGSVFPAPRRKDARRTSSVPTDLTSAVENTAAENTEFEAGAVEGGAVEGDAVEGDAPGTVAPGTAAAAPADEPWRPDPADRWRAHAVACALRSRGVDAEVGTLPDGRATVCSSFRADLAAVAHLWTGVDGDRRVPDDLELDGPRLRLWVLAAGRSRGRAYILGLDPDVVATHEPLLTACRRAGLDATLAGEPGAPELRIVGVRRRRRLGELVGDRPCGVPDDLWPV